MLRSMTGFGAVEAEIEGIEYAVEIRSVNNRYIKLIVKLPECWSRVEDEIDKLLRKRIGRGSVVLNIRMRVPDEKAAHRVNTAALKSYIDQLKILEMDADPMLRIDLVSLLQLPGVCEPPPLEDICQATRDRFLELVQKALAELLKMRCSEGEALGAELLNQCEVVESNLAAIQARSGEVVKDYHTRLAARVQELVNAGRVNIDADDLAREVAIFAERCDINEEISRLTAHLQQFRQAVDSAEPAGRKLDFIAQEMLREANTIASKANDAEIGRTIVEVKTAVDRIKEQVANVE